MINFSIPGFFIQDKVNNIFFYYFVNNMEKFYDDINITSCYDSFDCIWNGGRVIIKTCQASEIVDIIKFYSDLGIQMRYTWTNKFITEDMLNDANSNNILKLTLENSNLPIGINTNKDILRNYLQDNYPSDRLYFLASTTLGLKTIEDINEKSKDMIIVPDYSINNNWDIIDKLENKQNIEFLVGETCNDNCPYRDKHYDYLSKVQLRQTIEEWDCPYKNEEYSYYEKLPNRKHYIDIDSIREDYVPRGFTNFKISGRSDTWINLIEKYVNYFAKKEYRDRVRNELLLMYNSNKRVIIAPQIGMIIK